MLIYSMSVSVDGFIGNREGAFGWSVPSEELFRFHLDQVRGLGSYLCGRSAATSLGWLGVLRAGSHRYGPLPAGPSSGVRHRARYHATGARFEAQSAGGAAAARVKVWFWRLR